MKVVHSGLIQNIRGVTLTKQPKDLFKKKKLQVLKKEMKEEGLEPEMAKLYNQAKIPNVGLKRQPSHTFCLYNL